MANQIELSVVGQVLLARLLVAGGKGLTAAAIRKDSNLERLLRDRWQGAELVERLDRAAGELETAGLVERTRKGKTEKVTPTLAGIGAAITWLGLDRRPEKLGWPAVRNILVARALGLAEPAGAGAKWVASKTGITAALLRSHYNLRLGERPKLPDTLGALGWALMGVETNLPFNDKTVRAVLIGRALGEARIPDPKKAPDLLAAKVAGARRADPNELRDATLRAWVDRAESAADVRQNLGIFARRVLSAALTSPTGRLGDKVFIAHIWRTLAGQPEFVGLDADAFKRRLVEANHARLLDLGRADLVEALDPADVRESETPNPHGAPFHFVRLGVPS